MAPPKPGDANADAQIPPTRPLRGRHTACGWRTPAAPPSATVFSLAEKAGRSARKRPLKMLPRHRVPDQYFSSPQLRARASHTHSHSPCDPPLRPCLVRNPPSCRDGPQKLGNIARRSCSSTWSATIKAARRRRVRAQVLGTRPCCSALWYSMSLHVTAHVTPSSPNARSLARVPCTPRPAPWRPQGGAPWRPGGRTTTCRCCCSSCSCRWAARAC